MHIEAIDNAKEELKRADHLFYVSLKYTRTVDVIKSIVERLINACSFSLEALLFRAQKEKGLGELPKAPRLKAELVRKLFAGDEVMDDYINFYIYLRKVDKAPFTRKQEFRRHVTMTAEIDGEQVPIKIDDIKEYFEKIKSFVKYVHNILEPPDEDDY